LRGELLPQVQKNSAGAMIFERVGAQRQKIGMLSPPLQALTNPKLAILISGLEQHKIKQRARLAWRAACLTCRRSCARTSLSSGFKKKRQPRLFFRSRHRAPETPEQGPPTKTYAARLLCRDDCNGRCLRHDGSAHVVRIQADHLSWLGRLKSHLACQSIDSARIAQ